MNIYIITYILIHLLIITVSSVKYIYIYIIIIYIPII